MIVNSTSAGLKDEDYPIKKTLFIKLAQEEGIKVKDGEDMLLYQDVLAFELFTDTTLDNETIEKRPLKLYTSN